MNGPCLCGDPLCKRCFPGAGEPLLCVETGVCTDAGEATIYRLVQDDESIFALSTDIKIDNDFITDGDYEEAANGEWSPVSEDRVDEAVATLQNFIKTTENLNAFRYVRDDAPEWADDVLATMSIV